MQDSLGRPAFAGRSGSGTAMARIQIGGAGGAPSNNFIRSLRESARHDHIIGTNSIPSDLFLAEVDEKYVVPPASRSEEHTSELQSLMRISYAVFCLKKKTTRHTTSNRSVRTYYILNIRRLHC